MALPPVVSTRDPGRGETDHAEATAIRIRAEAAEIHTAAEQLAAADDPFREAVAAYLTVQAVLLERAGGTTARAILPDEDTVAQPGVFPSAARSALLIARTHRAARDDRR
ncbi:hypothetical protein OG233_30690 (plasmid) [Streptomyces sp. NBC_01218]|uniref:hypothetical protein n=1 Tax=Streptomyces sp. NBC_01218 TaxID=2903780 RepID=UPI002E101B60|nr:hypothetical protein OG233_30690 [Streptomyces sp. NBC_01218]